MEASVPPRDLPLDVVEDILSRLPVKSLVRFRAVCKNWRSLIERPSFIKLHLQKKICNSNQRLLLIKSFHRKPPREEFRLLLDSTSIEDYASASFPLRAKNGFLKVVGSSNGVICLSDNFCDKGKFDVILWNPLVMRYLRVPVHSSSDDKNMVVMGFGSDSWNQLKLVKLAYGWNRTTRIYNQRPEVEVYGVSNGGSWRRITRGVPSYQMVKSIWDQVFFNGAVNWYSYRSENHGFFHAILGFDMTDEAFRVMQVPNALMGIPHTLGLVMPLRVSIALYKEMIALLVNENDRCTVFAMKKYGVAESWEKLFVVVVSGEGGGIVSSVLGFRGNGQVILETREGGLVYCDEESTYDFQQLHINGEKECFYCTPFNESLVFLDSGVKSCTNSENTTSEDNKVISISKEELYRARMDKLCASLSSITPLGRGR